MSAHGDHIEDDGGPEIVLIEQEGPEGEGQSLWIRVGPVYEWRNDKGGSIAAGESLGAGETVRPEPGIWIEYQEEHMNTGLMGPVLISPETWDQLDKWVRQRLNSWKIKQMAEDDNYVDSPVEPLTGNEP